MFPLKKEEAGCHNGPYLPTNTGARPTVYAQQPTIASWEGTGILRSRRATLKTNKKHLFQGKLYYKTSLRHRVQAGKPHSKQAGL